MAKIGVGNLPEVSEVKDDDILLCSTDNKHVQKVKAKNVKGNGGGGSGGLMYWKETEDEFYSESNTEPTNMDAVIMYHEEDQGGGVTRYYYSVFGREFDFVPSAPSSSNVSKAAAIKRALALSKSSTNGYGAQPADFVTAIYDDQDINNPYYVGYVDLKLSNEYGWLVPIEGGLQSTYVYEGGWRWHEDPLKTIQGYDYDPRTKREYPLGITSADLFFTGLDHYSLTPHTINAVNYADPNMEIDLKHERTNDVTHGTHGELDPETQERHWEYVTTPNANRLLPTTVQFFFSIRCLGKFFEVGDDPTDWTPAEYENAVSTEYWPFKIPNARVENINYQIADQMVRERSLRGEYVFTDDNGIRWVIAMSPSPEPKNEGAAAAAGYDTMRPSGMNKLDLGYIHDHFCYYDGANPVDNQGTVNFYCNEADLTETASFSYSTLSDESKAVYDENIKRLALEIFNKLGLQSVPAQYLGDTPGDQIVYKTRSALSVKDNYTVFSAGTLDGDGNFTETVNINGAEGSLKLNGVPVVPGGGSGGSLVPVFTEGTKIADYISGEEDVELYIPPIDTEPYTMTAKKIGTWHNDLVRDNSYDASNIITTPRDIYEVTFTKETSTAGSTIWNQDYAIPVHLTNLAKYAETGNNVTGVWSYDFRLLDIKAYARLTSAKNVWRVMPSECIGITLDQANSTGKIRLTSPGSGTANYCSLIIIKIVYVG